MLQYKSRNVTKNSKGTVEECLFLVTFSPYIIFPIYVYVITPFGVVLLVYPPDTRGRVAPEGGGRINRNTTTKGVIKCLLPLIGRCGARASK